MILIGCEESGVITNAFRKAGYEAFSCDLKPTRGNPDWHRQGDVKQAIRERNWDLIIVHPDCTAMAVSGNRTYGKGKFKYQERCDQVKWTLNLWALCKDHSPRAALENPVSVIFPVIQKGCGDEVCYVQPWEHGHGETKRTGFALHNLPALKPSNIVEGREQRVWKMGPSENRKRDRSRTFEGIADASG